MRHLLPTPSLPFPAALLLAHEGEAQSLVIEEVLWI